jgi:hypothetical protein
MFRNQLEFGWHKGESIMALSENAGVGFQIRLTDFS